MDAIVYLPLDPDKRPEQSTWGCDKDTKVKVKSLLCIVPVYTKNDTKNLVSGWIEPCTLKTKNLDCISILRQFGELLKSLSNNNMDNKKFGEFYDFLRKEGNSETAVSVKEMFDDLPTYMTHRLLKEFEVKIKDEKVENHNDFCSIKFNNSDDFFIEIYPELTGYAIFIYSRNSEEDWNWTKKFEYLNSFESADNNTICNFFSFDKENEVVDCVEHIIEEIRKYCLRSSDEVGLLTK